ncbi:MAG: outer membrane beta-barrel protein [Acidobacteriaceae bacterium]|nr:outer membrane beta-barrel protein [Acidobacteriaceae bacterium]
MHAGRAKITGKTSDSYVYFSKFDNQRSWNSTNNARLDLPLSRFKPFIGGSYANTGDRTGVEIDVRVRHQEQAVFVGTAIAFSSKTALVLTGTQNLFVYDNTATFRDESLATNLNRQSRTETAQLRFVLTPLTTFTVTSDAIQDRFDQATTRNADSIRVMPGFEFKPFALISGRVAVGFRHFNVLDAGTPNYDGVVANVDAAYAIRATKISFGWTRDVNYSYDSGAPYYVLTSIPLSLTERITSKWDAIGRAAWQRLVYPENTSTSQAFTDNASLYGLGAGYRLAEYFRLGVDVNYSRRLSPLASTRAFSGVRAGFSVSYGSSQ